MPDVQVSSVGTAGPARTVVQGRWSGTERLPSRRRSRRSGDIRLGRRERGLGDGGFLTRRSRRGLWQTGHSSNLGHGCPGYAAY